MRALIISDIHGNMAALSAVLDTPQARCCERIISLGDQVNLGPQPREVMTCLTHLHATMLLGNHEERFRRITSHEFDGYNWAPLRWTWTQVKDFSFDFPVDLRLGPVLLTHGTPGDPYHLVDSAGVKDVLDGLDPDVRLLLSGHNHAAWRVESRGRTAVNPGSLGLLESERSAAAFAVLETSGDEAIVTRYTVPYDVAEVQRAYLTSGMAQAAPEIARICLALMLYGGDSPMLTLMRHVQQTAAQMGKDFGDLDVWRQADHSFAWREAMDSPMYWKEMEQA